MSVCDSRANHKLTRLSTSPSLIGACSRCEITGTRYEELKTTVYTGFDRWLDESHALHCNEPCPVACTHEKLMEDIATMSSDE